MFLCTTGYFDLVEALQEISGYTVLKLVLASFNIISKFIYYYKTLGFSIPQATTRNFLTAPVDKKQGSWNKNVFVARFRKPGLD